MNKTKIEWCDSTWNPVTGCLHDCPYCYARGIAQRFGKQLPDRSGYPEAHNDLHCIEAKIKGNPYPYIFEPTLLAYKLKEPRQKTKPQTIFVCSMADLFGEWMPTKWIVDVLDACQRAPQHRYLFLTKNPQRYRELDELALLPRLDNFWYGSTATTGDASIFYSGFHNTFVSVEPIMEPFTYPSNHEVLRVGWVILGAETGNRKQKVIPERSWVEPIVRFCKENGKSVFMKGSMTAIWGEPLITEFPWEVSI